MLLEYNSNKDAKINGHKFKQKLDICMVSKYLVKRKISNFTMEKSSRHHLN